MSYELSCAMRCLARRRLLAKAAALCTRTLESLNPDICPLEKNSRDRIFAIPVSGHGTFFKVISMSPSASDQISGF
jgi:hypothetical protein